MLFECEGTVDISKTTQDPSRLWKNIQPYRRQTYTEYYKENDPDSRCTVNTVQGYCFFCDQVETMESGVYMSTYMIRKDPYDFQCECEEPGFYLWVDPLSFGVRKCRMIPVRNCK